MYCILNFIIPNWVVHHDHCNFLSVLYSVLFGLSGDNNIIYIGQCNSSAWQISEYRIDVPLKNLKIQWVLQKLILSSVCHKRRIFSAFLIQQNPIFKSIVLNIFAFCRRSNWSSMSGNGKWSLIITLLILRSSTHSLAEPSCFLSSTMGTCELGCWLFNCVIIKTHFNMFVNNTWTWENRRFIIKHNTYFYVFLFVVFVLTGS